MKVPEQVWVVLIPAIVSAIGVFFTTKDHGKDNMSDERKNMLEKYNEVYEKLDKALDEKRASIEQMNEITKQKDKAINERDDAIKDRDEWQNKYSQAVSQLKKQDAYIRELKDRLKK